MALLDSWYPVTGDFGLIDAPRERFASAYHQWHCDLEKRPSRAEVSTSLSAAFEALPPLSMGLYRSLFISTRNGWTAFFRSGLLGSDPSPVMGVFAGQFGCQAMRVCTPPGGGAIWEVYAPESMGGAPPLLFRRTIANCDDGGWVFEQSGEPFPFEDLDRYRARRTRDRFDAALLSRYLGEFGLDAFNEDFYTVDAATPAIVIEDGARHAAFEEFTLQQARARRPRG